MLLIQTVEMMPQLVHKNVQKRKRSRLRFSKPTKHATFAAVRRHSQTLELFFVGHRSIHEEDSPTNPLATRRGKSRQFPRDDKIHRSHPNRFHRKKARCALVSATNDPNPVSLR